MLPTTFKPSPVLMARNSAVSIRVRFYRNRKYMWGKEICELQKEKNKNKNWNDQFKFHSGNRSLLENKMRKNLCHHAGSQQWAESAELVAQQGNISQQQLAVTHGGQPLTPCWLLLFGSLPFLRRLYEAMDDCLPQRATLHTPGISVTVLWL